MKLASCLALCAILSLTAPARPAELVPGDLLIADPDAVAIVRVDPTDGVQEIIAFEGELMFPVDLVLEPSGSIAVADPDAGTIFRIDPDNGAQTVVVTGFAPWGIALDADSGLVFVNNDHEDSTVLYRIAAGGTTADPVSDDPAIVFPLRVAIADDGTLYVTDLEGPTIFAVDPSTGAANAISTGLPLVSPTAITIDSDGNLLVADSLAGAIFRIDPDDGVPLEISNEDGLGFPTGVALNARGDLVVSDGDSSLGATPRIVALDPAGGAVDELSSGGELVFPNGIRVVPEPGATTMATAVLATLAVLARNRQRRMGAAN